MHDERPPVAVAIVGMIGVSLIGWIALAVRPDPDPPYLMLAEQTPHSLGERDGERVRLHGWIKPGTITEQPWGFSYLLYGGTTAVVVELVTPDLDCRPHDQSELVVTGWLDGDRLIGERAIGRCPSKYQGYGERDRCGGRVGRAEPAFY